MSDTLRRYKASEICLHEASGQSIRMNALFYLAADVERVEAAEAKRVKSYYDSRQGTLQRENATLREQLEQHEHALAAKEAQCADLMANLELCKGNELAAQVDILKADLARVREALREALVIMRNYYGHAISRAAVEEFITKSQQHIQPSRGEQG